MIRSLRVKANIYPGYTESILIENPLNERAISVNAWNFAYYAYKTAVKYWKAAPCSHAEEAVSFTICDGWSGAELCQIERYKDSEGQEMIRFINI